jgi:AcrR family transcriptional regulator
MPAAPTPSVPGRSASRARRDRIVDTAFELIQASGGDDIHIRHVAERADVALATAYRYFGSKDRLFAEAHERWVTDHCERLLGLARRERDNVQRVRRLALGFLDVYLREPHFVRVGRQLRTSDDPEVVTSLRRCDELVVTMYRDALDGIQRRDAASIAMLLASLGLSVFEAVRRKVISPEQARRQVGRAVHTVLVFRDPSLESAGTPAVAPTRTRRRSAAGDS